MGGELPQTSLSCRVRGGRLASCPDPEAPPCPSGGAAWDLRGAGLAPGSRVGTHRSRVRMSSSCSPGEGQGPVSLAGRSSQPPDPRVTCGFCLPCPHSHHPERSAHGAGGNRHAHQGGCEADILPDTQSCLLSGHCHAWQGWDWGRAPCLAPRALQPSEGPGPLKGPGGGRRRPGP